jgi:hypothetical protein
MMLLALGGVGVIILISGGGLARSGALRFESQETSEHIVGLLIIAGLSLIGASLGICFGAPLP